MSAIPFSRPLPFTVQDPTVSHALCVVHGRLLEGVIRFNRADWIVGRKADVSTHESRRFHTRTHVSSAPPPNSHLHPAPVLYNFGALYSSRLAWPASPHLYLVSLSLSFFMGAV